MSTQLLRGKQFPAPVEKPGTMCRRRHPWLAFAIFSVLVASSSSAHAQSWLSDRKRAEGRGIRVGDFELHPGVGVEGGIHTNPFFSDKPDSSWVFRVSPHLFFSTLSGERAGASESQSPTPGWLALNGGVAGTFQHYTQFAVRDAINLDLNGSATLAPERPVSLSLTQALRRSALPFSDTQLPPSLRDRFRAADYTNYFENAGLQLNFRTNGGLLRGGLGYNFGYIWFNDGNFKFNNNITHSATLNLGWEFLPKTALFYDATFKHQTFTKLDDRALSTMAVNRLVNNDVITSRIGINGAVTSRIGATVAVGYTAGFYDEGDEPEGVIGSVEGRFTPTNLTEAALTFDRGFLPSYQGNYQDRTRIMGRFRWLFVGALLVTAQAGVEFLTFGFDAVQRKTRDDRRYLGDLSAEYRFTDWLALTGQLTMLIDDTDFQFTLFETRVDPNTMQPTRMQLPPDPARFSAYEAWLGIRAFL